jgi:hypothetical protein
MNEHYQAVLADLRQMKADAEAGIRAIERLISVGSATALPPIVQLQGTIQPPRQVEAESAPMEEEDASGLGSVPQQVLMFLNDNPGATFTTAEIAEAISPRCKTQTLRGALGRLYKIKKIGKYGRGRFRAKRPNETELSA